MSSEYRCGGPSGTQVVAGAARARSTAPLAEFGPVWVNRPGYRNLTPLTPSSISNTLHTVSPLHHAISTGLSCCCGCDVFREAAILTRISGGGAYVTCPSFCRICNERHTISYGSPSSSAPLPNELLSRTAVAAKTQRMRVAPRKTPAEVERTSARHVLPRTQVFYRKRF